MLNLKQRSSLDITLIKFYISMITMIGLIIGFFFLSISLMGGQYWYVRYRITQETIIYLNSFGYHVISIKPTSQKFDFESNVSNGHLYNISMKNMHVGKVGRGSKIMWKKAIVSTGNKGYEKVYLIAIETIMARPVGFHLKEIFHS